jgi:serine/threonine protein kinase
MAPEVFMKTNTEGHGRAADVWSVGCVVVEMASGKVCFTKVMNSVASNSVSIDLFGKI